MDLHGPTLDFSLSFEKVRKNTGWVSKTLKTPYSGMKEINAFHLKLLAAQHNQTDIGQALHSFSFVFSFFPESELD